MMLIVAALSLTGVQALVAQISVKQMYHKSWTSRDGAPDNIEAIVQGPGGFLWLTTDAGLYRFDGVSFHRYVPPDGFSLMSENFTTIHATSDGSLWISYLAGGLARLKEGHIRNYTERDGFAPQNQISSLVEDRDGAVWAGGLRGLEKITNSEVATVGIQQGLPAGAILSLAVDNEENLWTAQQHALLVLPHGSSRFILAASWSGDEVVGCSRSRGGGVWWWRSDGPLKRFQLIHGKISKTNVSPLVPESWQLEEASDGAIWIGTQNRGLIRFHSRARLTEKDGPPELESFSARDGLTSDFAFQVVEDAEGSVWVATTKGLDQFRSVPFRAVEVGQSAPVVLPQGRSDSRFIVASDHVIDLSNGEPATLPLPVREWTWTRSMYEGDDGTLWIGTIGHLWKYKGGQFSAQALPSELNGRQPPVLAIVQDSSHQLWISVGGGFGLFRLDGNQWLKDGGYCGIPNEAALTAQRDLAGGLWFGFRNDRVVRISDGQVTEMGKTNGLDVGDVNVFALDATDIWIGGSRGVALLRAGKFFSVHLAEGEALQGVTGLVLSADGALWINKNDGVVRMDEAEITLWRAQPAYLAKYRYFDSHDGLQGIPHPLVGLGSARMASDGKLYIATRTNLQWIDPQHLPHNSHVPQIWITGWKADNRSGMWPSTPLVLEPRITNLQIGYSGTSLLIPDRVHFRYKLDGFDKSWIDAGTRRQAFYSRLPPGHYTFRVIACNDSGIWNDIGASIVLTVPPTFIQTVWFEVLCLIAIACIALMAYRLRIRQVAAQIRKNMYDRLAERERIARDLHDTFFQSIQGLLLRVNTATGQLRNNEPARSLLLDALEESDRVMLMGRELVLDLRSSTNYDEELSEAFSEVGEEFKIYGLVEFPVIVLGQSRPLHPFVAREIYGLGREALCNAFRHAKAKKIEAELNFGKENFSLNIRDDGIGIEQEILSRGKPGHMGLSGMLERARKIDAKFTVWSKKGSGTEISLSVPSRVAYIQRDRQPWYRRWNSYRRPYEGG